jgi:hypothetical protein
MGKATGARILIQGQKNNSIVLSDTQNASVTYQNFPKDWHRVFVNGVLLYESKSYEDATNLADWLSKKILLMEDDEILLVDMRAALN